MNVSNRNPDIHTDDVIAEQTLPKEVADTMNTTPEMELGDDLDFFNWDEEMDADTFFSSTKEVPLEQFKAKTQQLRTQWQDLSSAEQLKIRVGEEVRSHLLLNQMRQSELARRLNKDRAWVSRVVKGKENITLETLSALAEALGCSPVALLRSDETPHASQTAAQPVPYPSRESHVALADPLYRPHLFGTTDKTLSFPTPHHAPSKTRDWSSGCPQVTTVQLLTSFCSPDKTAAIEELTESIAA